MTTEQQLNEAKDKIAALEDTLAKANATIKQQGQLIDDLRTGVAMGDVSTLPEEVQADFRDRMAAGLPKDVALERALHQHRHNQELAKAKSAEATTGQPTAGKAKAK